MRRRGVRRPGDQARPGVMPAGVRRVVQDVVQDMQVVHAAVQDAMQVVVQDVVRDAMQDAVRDLRSAGMQPRLLAVTNRC